MLKIIIDQCVQIIPRCRSSDLFTHINYCNSTSSSYITKSCREVSPGLDVRETSSHPRCVQSRTHRTCKYVWFLSHTPSHTHYSSLRYICWCFVNIFSAKKINGLLILLYLHLDYLYCIFSLFFSSVSVG